MHKILILLCVQYVKDRLMQVLSVASALSFLLRFLKICFALSALFALLLSPFLYFSLYCTCILLPTWRVAWSLFSLAWFFFAFRLVVIYKMTRFFFIFFFRP